MALVKGTNSYQDAADGDLYFADRINGANWIAAATATKEQALVSATDWLDRQVWVGEQTQPKPTQPLDWPRTGVTDPEGIAVDSGTVPSFIEHGCLELAAALIDDPTILDLMSATGDNVKKVKGGSAEIEFFFDPSTVAGTKFPKIVMELVSFYLESSASVTNPLASGTDEESGLDTWGRESGL